MANNFFRRENQSILLVSFIFFTLLFAIGPKGMLTTKRQLDETDSIHNGDFQNRHKREPKEKNFFPTSAPTISPTADPCSQVNDGLFGTPSSNQLDIQYTYEIEISPDIESELESQVIPAVEETISESLVENFVESCSGKDIQSRRLSETVIAMVHGYRFLEIQGISSSPPDKIDDNEYLTAYEGIIRISYGKALLPEIEKEDFVEITVQPPFEPVFSKSLSYTIIGAVSGALIILAFLFGKDGARGDSKDQGAYLTGEFIEIESNLTDDHVYPKENREEGMEGEFPQEVSNLRRQSSSSYEGEHAIDEEDDIFPFFGIESKETEIISEKGTDFDGESRVRIV